MVSLTDVRTHNAALKSLAPGLVAVFVGGTSGIGLYTAREFVRNTTSPKVYLIGRNETEATRISQELKTINTSSQVDFIKKDVSLLRQVDEACKEIKEKEKSINLLFLTIGVLTMKGRNETSEGLDFKFSLHYYARMRFIQNLCPLLAAAANNTTPNATLSRVVSVYDPNIGKKNKLNFADLALKNSFSLGNCATHGSAMQNFALDKFAKQSPNTSFIHAHPSIVKTSLGRGAMWKLVYGLLSPWTVDEKESGERHLFAATAPRYAPTKSEGVENVVMGSNGVKGSGSYALTWEGEAVGESMISAEMRKSGAEGKVWDHTQEVFKTICEDGSRY